MPELDYAYLADYASVQGDKLTAVGASYTRLTLATVPTGHLLAVAGRIRTTVNHPELGLDVEIVSPGDNYTLKFDAELAATPEMQPYAGGKLGLLFALSTIIPINVEGIYKVNLYLEGELARALAFEAMLG